MPSKSNPALKLLLLLGLRKNIGSGFETWVWSDPWITGIPDRPTSSRFVEKGYSLLVSNLINAISKSLEINNLPRRHPLIFRSSSEFSNLERLYYCWIIQNMVNIRSNQVIMRLREPCRRLCPSF